MVTIAKGVVFPNLYTKDELKRMVKETEYSCPCCGSGILKFDYDEDSSGEYWIDSCECLDCGNKFAGHEVDSITTYWDGHEEKEKGECHVRVKVPKTGL